jgi:hypothetical protein
MPNDYQHGCYKFDESIDLRRGDDCDLFSMFETPAMSKRTNKYSNYDKSKNYRSSRTTFNEVLVVKFVIFL